MIKFPFLPHVLAILITSLGMVVLYGWIFHISAMVQIFPGLIGMVANTAICFILTGIVILLYNITTNNKQAKLVLISAIFLIASLSLFQTIASVDIGIDRFLVANWLDDPNPTPGRMAPNTSVGFMLVTSILLLIPKGNNRFVAGTIQILTFCVFLLALVGLLVYTLKLEYIFTMYSYTRMALHTAIGFIFVSLALWQTYKKYSWYGTFYHDNPQRKIHMVIGGFLISISLIAAFGNTAILAYKNVISIEQSLQHILNEKINIFEYSYKNAIRDINATLADPIILANIIHDKRANVNSFNERMNILVAKGFSGLKLVSSDGKTLWSQGTFNLKNQLALSLKDPDTSKLIYQNGFYLQLSLPIRKPGSQDIFAHFYGEKPLEFFNQTYSNYQEFKKTGEIVLCGTSNVNQYVCFPSRLTPHSFIIPAEIDGYPSAISQALQGQIGTANNYDYRHQRVIAAFSPIGKTGLGIVAKIDANEIYKPIHDDLIISMLIALLLVTAGLLLLHWQIAPLMAKIFTAQKETIEANKKLQASEERYEVAVKSSNTGLWDWDVNTGRVFYSPQVKQLIGYRDEELNNDIQTFHGLLHPDDKQRILQALKQHISHDQPYNVEYRLRHKTGEYHWYHSTGKAIRDAKGQATRMAGSLIDITDRKTAEAHLSMQYELAKVLSETMTLENSAYDIVCILRKGLNFSFGSIWLVDEDKHHLYNIGHCSDKIKDSSFAKCTETLTFPSGIGLPGRVWRSGTPIWIENIEQDNNFPRKPQAMEANLHSAFCFPIIWQNKVLGVIELFSTEIEKADPDIIKISHAISNQLSQFIQRTKVAEKLIKSESHMTAILDSASDSIITLDQEGHILSYNQETKKLINHLNKSFTNIRDLIADLTPEKIKNIINQPPVEFNANKPGENLPIEITISSMQADQHVLVAILRDISERKKIDILKNEFISVVSHELRTPLTSIRGSLALLASGTLGELSPGAKKFLTIANNNCERLLNLINDILDIEKIEAGKMDFKFKTLDITKLVNEAVSNNQFYGEKNKVKINFVSSVEGMNVNVDPDRLMQVMANLLSNAVKFSPTGGEVDVATTQHGDKIRISVADKGPGISEEFRDKIFQKFSQADSSSVRKVGGTGLGLNITKSIVEKMGGDISFKTEVGKGTVFYVDFPLVTETVS